eukprot:1797621-Prymnesium_polylepis.1
MLLSASRSDSKPRMWLMASARLRLRLALTVTLAYFPSQNPATNFCPVSSASVLTSARKHLENCCGH